MINVRVWTLRSEIEAAIKAITHAAGTVEYQNELEAIADFYRLSSHAQPAQSGNGNDAKPSLALVDTPAEEVDEDMAAMMDALGTPEKSEANDAEQAPTNDAVATNVQATQEIKNIQRTIPANESLSFGNLLLSDINMDMALVFSKNAFTIGQTVAIEFLIPKRFILSAEIDYCQSIVFKSKIISDKKPEFRIRLRFKHIYPAERTNLRNLLKSIEPNNLYKNKPSFKNESETEKSQTDIDSSLAELGL